MEFEGLLWRKNNGLKKMGVQTVFLPRPVFVGTYHFVRRKDVLTKTGRDVFLDKRVFLRKLATFS